MSFWGELVDGVRDVAPALAGAAGTALSGGNPLAGAALASLARRLTGAGKDEPLESIAEGILGNPDQVMQFRLEARKLELDELRLRTLDVQDARKTLSVSQGAVVVSAVVLLSYFAAMLVAMFVEIPPGSVNIAYLLLGNLATGFGMVLTFWLGSSKGSKEKDAILARYVNAASADQTARQGGR